ncbi:HD domain-containing phosphohydrolase [Sporomusa aerivorans]|uniref:HD domain-containing phosphohydrolase n=1 Tax=Sporomusa aerivorans TaxID=204936 RepID=UPI00352AB5A9
MEALLQSTGVHEFVEAFTAALDAKNTYTKGHSDRVAEIAAAIAKALGLSKATQDSIHVAAHLHDIGKIGIPDHILLKPDRLSSEEFEVIKSHPQMGFEILNKVTLLRPIAKIVRHHHERWDGGGYPAGLAGKTIPLGARIIALADAFDAMTSARSYRARMSQEEAVKEVLRCRGTQFDPDIANAFVALCQNTKWPAELAAVKPLSEMRPGEKGRVTQLTGKGPLLQRMLDLGVITGTKVEVRKYAPLGDPMEVKIQEFNLSLRKNEAKFIEVAVE